MAKGKKRVTKLPPITDTVERNHLTDVEAKGIDFESINLAELCNKKEAIYGPPSTDGLRRSVQKHWSKVKKRHPKNYVKLLRKYDITPGPFTFHRLRAVLDEEPPNEPPTIEKEPSLLPPVLSSAVEQPTTIEASIQLPIEDTDSSDSESLLEDITSKLASLALASPPRPTRKMADDLNSLTQPDSRAQGEDWVWTTCIYGFSDPSSSFCRLSS
jgi:hypothetical protein